MSTQVTRIFLFDASGCNGCDVEVLEATTLVALGELGNEIAERPDDANLLVVTGGSNLKSKRELSDRSIKQQYRSDLWVKVR